MQIKKIWKALFLCSVILVLIPNGKVSAKAFTDVKTTNSHYNAILELSDRKVINGYKDNTFKPSGNVTRAQAAKILANVLQLDTTKYKTSKFKDVKTTSEFLGPIHALAEEGIVSGYNDGTFKPNAKLTRAQMAKIIYNSFELADYDLKLPFEDVKPGTETERFVTALYYLKITTGSTETTYAPTASVTRGQMASFVVRAEQFSDQWLIVEEIE